MTKRILLLVEGETEERFVKNILAPHFLPLETYLYPTIVNTKKVKSGPNFKGGITSFRKFESDLNNVIGGAGDGLVTTIIDYYGLPSDFPGMENRLSCPSPLLRVKHIESAIGRHFRKTKNLLPFVALHEFEAWLFSSPIVLPEILADPKQAAHFANICSSFQSPEDINEGAATAPSKRIDALYPAYRKKLHGSLTIGRIGLPVVRKKCSHFNEWLHKLEHFARS